MEVKLNVYVEYGELRADFTGNPNEVAIAFLDFLKEVHPTFEVARRLMFKPDLIKLSRALEGVIEYSSDGLILIPEELTSEEATLLSLLGTYVGTRLRLLAQETMSVSDIAIASNKASKTILNQLKGLIDEGFVERVGRGEYHIKSLGIKRSEQILHTLQLREPQ